VGIANDPGINVPLLAAAAPPIFDVFAAIPSGVVLWAFDGVAEVGLFEPVCPFLPAFGVMPSLDAEDTATVFLYIILSGDFIAISLVLYDETPDFFTLSRAA